MMNVGSCYTGSKCDIADSDNSDKALANSQARSPPFLLGLSGLYHVKWMLVFHWIQKPVSRQWERADSPGVCTRSQDALKLTMKDYVPLIHSLEVLKEASKIKNCEVSAEEVSGKKHQVPINFYSSH